MIRIKLPLIHHSTISEITDWIRSKIPDWSRGIVIGLSGGIDSSLVFALSCIAFRIQNSEQPNNRKFIRAYFIPSIENTSADETFAEGVFKSCGDNSFCSFEKISIQKIVEAFDKVESKTACHAWRTKSDRENMISSIRMNVLWTEASKNNMIVMGTGNKDEDYGIGYYTLRGDGLVHLNPIGFLSKRLVKEMSSEVNIPGAVVLREPSAGLSKQQTDFGDLGYRYELVELVLEGLEQGFSVPEIIASNQVQEEAKFTSSPFKIKEYVFDIIYRHEVALEKAELVRPKVPQIVLEKY